MGRRVYMFYGNPFGPCADCVAPPIVHPPKNCYVNKFSSTLVPHIHPTKTTVVNHHIMKHTHLYPHSTSFANTYQNVDIGPSTGITPAYGGYGMPSYADPYSSTMMPSMPTPVSGGSNSGYPSAGMMPPAYPTQVAPIPGVKEMPMYPGMKTKKMY